MATIDDPGTLNSALQSVDNLEESLLVALELTHHGYSTQLRFEHLRLGRPVSESRKVSVLMEAVSSLRLDGGLSEAMVQHPEAINWGLSEIAGASAYSAGSGVGLLIAWEGDRQIRVEAARVHFSTSTG